MDDVDHSIDIAECDWASFCEETEECSLLKPSVACSDSSGLSDSDDYEILSPVQPSKSWTGGEHDEGSLLWLDSDMCSVYSAGNILTTTEVQAKAAEETKATDNITGSSHKLQKEVMHLETEAGDSRNEPDPPFFGHVDVSRVGARAEERWFVTVNDRPAPQAAASSGEKKTKRQKAPCRSTRSSKQEKSVENVLEMIKDKSASDGGRDNRGSVQLEPSLVPKTGEASSAQTNHESRPTCCKGETVSLTGHIAEPPKGRDTHAPASASREVFSLKDPSHVEAAESDELEFCSIHSHSSESNLSAAGSAEEASRHLKDHVTENQQLLLLATSHLPLSNHAQDRGACVSCSAPATECGGYEGAGVEPAPAFPSADQRANEMPDVSSACDQDTHSTQLLVPSHTPTPCSQELHLPAPGSPSGHQLSPGLNVAPCSVTSSSETRAAAPGLTGPVFAASPFWNEMEKRTISDLLQLRMCRRTHAEALVAPGSPTDHTFLADSVECGWSDAEPADTSDTADSGYFTQPDESKPNFPSCEFFEEDYWHFTGASRNPSPEPHDKNHPRTSGSCFPSHEEPSCSCSEGKDAPVPSEDCAGQRLDHHESHTLGKMTKTKSGQNVQALLLPSQSLLGNDENSLLPSCSPALEETAAQSSTDTSRHYQISIPELFEYFFAEDEAKSDTRGPVCGPEDVSATPVLDCTFCRNEMCSCALCDSQETPIAVYSRSHPTNRKLTFPEPNNVALSAHSEDGDVSPVRLRPRAFTQASKVTAGASRSWQTLLSIRKVGFHTKGSTFCRRSGAWVFPADAEKASGQREDPPSAAVTEEQTHWRIWETLHTRQEGVFSSLKQSDICLVCIAFASWVLRSSNPEAADAWKAALLANVSALSAIQFLRHYVKKTPIQDDP